MKPLPPGSVIGILGGGQLGRMLAVSAAELGFDVHIYTPEEDSPASRVAARTTVAAFDDADALARFASQVDVVTTEFENVPADTTRALVNAGAIVHPNPEALAIAQDRVAEKRFFNECGIATAPFAVVDSRADLDAALKQIGTPAILKTRRLGYDGKGQARIATLTDAEAAYAALGGEPTILEGFCAFEREVSIVAARSIHNGFAPFDLVENEHAHGILARTIAPARVDARVQEQAKGLAYLVGDALDYAGVFAIEFFLMADGSLIANEMAPRVHNSGHWTQDACVASQFEQHIRAVADWPLASPARLCDAEMINLIGDDVNQWAAYAAEPNTRVHLYGKREARPGRKMGHVTRLKR